MQITDVRGIPLSYEVPKPFMSAAGVQRVRHALRTELLEEPIGVGPDSLIRVPDGPGLGIELNRPAVDKYRAEYDGVPSPGSRRALHRPLPLRWARGVAPGAHR